MNRLAVRSLKRRDVDAVLEIDAQVYPHPWSRELVENEIGHRGRHHVVATVGRTIVGHAGLLFAGDEAHVTTVAVDPSMQGQSLGRTLMLDLAHAARAKGCTAMTLEVRASNAAAIALYRRFGMAPAGVRPGYYRTEGGAPEDALILWVHDIHSDEYADRLVALDPSKENAA